MAMQNSCKPFVWNAHDFPIACLPPRWSYCFAALAMGLILAGPLPAVEPAPAQKPNAEAFRAMRYGLFSHVVYRLTLAPDGGKEYRTVDEFIRGFDVQGMPTS